MMLQSEERSEMTLVLEGIRVLEVAEYGLVPSGASVLGEWGADVVKVEHARRGDPIRGLTTSGTVGPGTKGFAPMWEPFNRSKRSIGVDLAVPEGRQIILDLAAKADVFLTSFLPDARKKLGIDVDDLRAVNPRIIYARGSAHGQKGAEASAGGFDALAYWLRTGVGTGTMPAGAEELIMQPGPGFGDVQTGLTLAGGVAAALFHRERTGEALEVDTSLLAQGIWAMMGSLVAANLAGVDEMPRDRRNRKEMDNALMNTYRTGDGRWVILGMIQPDPYWDGFCKAIGHPELVDDPRFVDFAARKEHRRELIDLLDEVFATAPLEEWKERLSQQDGPWSPVQRVGDLNRDKQAWDNGYLQSVDYGDGRELTLATAPLQFNGESHPLRRAPEFAESTEEVLLELGRSWDDIDALRQAGAI
jgi:crotonobetainyl-CoA:carnitine CoA-transferase CaiB-like acyl-CoA transferase